MTDTPTNQTTEAAPNSTANPALVEILRKEEMRLLVLLTKIRACIAEYEKPAPKRRSPRDGYPYGVLDADFDAA